MKEQDYKSLRPIRGAEYWQIETQNHINERYQVRPERYPSRRNAVRAGKRALASSSHVRVVRVLEVRFSGEKDMMYRKTRPYWEDET